MKLKQIAPICLVIVILIAVTAISSKNNSSHETNQNQATADTAQAVSFIANPKTEEELRGVWISYMELTMENEKDKSEKRFTEKFEAIAKDCKSLGYNTLIVQVRPFCDAIYKSDYFPWSHILTGEQGKNPNYDALKIICEICKKEKLKIHAWLNPYRISTQSTPNLLCNDNPYVKDSSIGFKTKSGVFLDPSNENARKLITDGIEEIVENYDIDAIQFDDYFYPAGMENQDEEQYNAYIKNCKNDRMSLEDWRKANVNLLISEVYLRIHCTKSNVDFGISPQGNINNSDKLFADVRLWCTTRGYIDYICPQIYFSLDNPALTFEDSLDSWCNLEFAKNVKMYIGLAGYKAGTDSDSGTWLKRDDILKSEYEIIKDCEKADGFMMFSYASLNSSESEKEMNNLHSELK